MNSCKLSLNLDYNNLTSLILLAYCYKQMGKYTECIKLCLYLIRQNPKFTEAFLLYLESLQCINSWNDLEENMKTLNSIVEYHHHIKNMNTHLNFFIADFYVKNLDYKLWIYEINCYQDIRDVKFAFDEIPNYEFENSKRNFSAFKPLKIGYLIEDIKDEYTLKLVVKMLSRQNNIKIGLNHQVYFIIFESEKEEANNTSYPLSFNWKEKIKCIKIFNENKIIDLTDEENPKSKAEFLFKLQFDVIIFLENLVYNPYNNILLRKIYQTLSLKPAKIQILLPYNGCSRIGNNKIFDYVITHKFNKFLDKFKEKTIVMETPLFCLNPYEENFEGGLDNDPFINLKSQDIKILANFSECCKIDLEIFETWCEILNKVHNTCLVLKFCNVESENNLKSFAANLGIDAHRIIFLNFKSEKSEITENTNTSTISMTNNLFVHKYSSHRYIKFINLYLDVQTVTGDLEIFFCNFQNIPCVSLNSQNFPITSSLSETIGIKNLCTNLQEYKNTAITILNNNELIIPKKLECSPIDKFINSMDLALNKIKKDCIIEKIENVYI
jgi:protein O-GlcNAc transferase